MNIHRWLRVSQLPLKELIPILHRWLEEYRKYAPKAEGSLWQNLEKLADDKGYNFERLKTEIEEGIK